MLCFSRLMTIFNNEKFPITEKYLKGLHQLKEIDVAIFIRLLQESKRRFTAKDVLKYCEEWCVHNYEREAYNILSRLRQNELIWKIKKNELIWKIKKGAQKNIYERIGVEGLKNELEEGIQDLREELVKIKEGSIYESSNPRENTQALDTERQLINALLKFKKQGYNMLFGLRYCGSLPVVEADIYKRFMNKLRRSGINFEVEKEADIVLLEKAEHFFIIFLTQYDNRKTKKINFYGCQIEDNGKLYKHLKYSLSKNGK